MSNETCGDCKYYNDAMSHCEKFDCMTEDSWYCPDCEEKIKPKPTNGDRIRQMSNDELATWGMYDLGTCPTFEKQQTCPKCGECSASEIEECWLAWLNAPAESEGKDE